MPLKVVDKMFTNSGMCLTDFKIAAENFNLPLPTAMETADHKMAGKARFWRSEWPGALW